MDRRESLKSMLVGTLAGGAMVNGCAPKESEEVAAQTEQDGVYGRTEKEKLRDDEIRGQKYFSVHELETIAILCDIILPAEDGYTSATSVDVPEFIEFMAKDLPTHQLPLRGGIMWIDNFANEQYQKDFKSCSTTDQMNLIDQIAFPEEAEPSVSQGVRFFSRVRNLTLTGFYTTRKGIEELGYLGNTPNVWDGVPQDVLKKHGLQYEKEWLTKCIDQNTRMDLAQWDENGNLIA